MDKRPIPKIVLTGGPSGGKTTLQRTIAQKLPEAYCAPEVATILLGGGFPAPTEQHTWDEHWQHNFQLAVAAAQLALETVSVSRAARESKRIAVFDRGLLDGAAYLSDGIAGLEEITGRDEQTMLGEYHMVIHLTSSAVHDAYDKESNPHRFEEAEAALELDQRIMEVWGNHPNRIVLDQADKIERVSSGIAVVRSIIEEQTI